MSKTKRTPVYEAKDGSTHDTPEAAEKQDELLAAQEELRMLAHRVRVLIGEAALTADGEQFNFRRWSYWRIADYFLGGMPRLVEVFGIGHDAEIDTERDRLIVRWFDRPDHREGRYIEMAINELYASKEAATEAWLHKCREYAASVQKELADIEEQAKKGRR